jgi:hypothetical protein
MPFDSTSITEIIVDTSSHDLFIHWTSPSSFGVWFQVYVNGTLNWCGQARHCSVPRPAYQPGQIVAVEVGEVLPQEIYQDFSSILSGSKSLGTVTLNWLGGSYLDPSGGDDVLGFTITSSRTPNTAIDPTNVVGSVLAYPGGWIGDGFGLGPFGKGGFGRAASEYSWKSGANASGTWQFAVQPFDHAGNSSPSRSVVTCNIQSIPLPPPRNSTGLRLTYKQSNASSGQYNLGWI